MKKGIIIITALIIIGGGGYYVCSCNNDKTDLNKGTIATQTTNNNQNKTDVKKTSNIVSQDKKTQEDKELFSKEDMKNYYKLSQNVGDIGLPSSSMTTNLDSYKTIDGVNYYSTYSYDTRSAYGNDTSVVKDGNHAHLVNSKIISLDKKSISKDDFGKISVDNLNDMQLEREIRRIAAMYIEGYTANDPNLVVNENDNYQGNLNILPAMKVNINNYKIINNEKVYQVVVTLNGYTIPLYVGLDGYVYVSSEQDYDELFFPNRVK